MRRTLSIFLLTCILTNVVGFYVYFYFRLKEIKREVAAELVKISPVQLKKIKLPVEDYHRFKKGDNEIKLDDVMYDITTIRFGKDSVEILALEDLAESNLLLLVSQITKAISNDSKTPPLALFQYLGLNFMLPCAPEKLNTRPFTEIEHNTFYCLLYNNKSLLIFTPPPRG